MFIRDEAPSDRAAIRSIIAAAFEGLSYSNQREGDLVDALRNANALTLSLVAEDSGAIIGHIAVSPVTIEGASLDWFGLGPLAVRPERQRKGVGAALVERALSTLRAADAAGCVVFGAPSYYGRFGFRIDPGVRFEGGPPEHFMALALGSTIPRGSVDYHPAFALVG
ncbi:MAG TPA: N-acetyltransferase [Methylosinus sp.]|jgi:putative acetyltransferase|uniref:GNAT family N-acetyltransferase n=1 Tax=Hyphomicrobiales TaxID=356 RepID=UPI002F9346F0